MNEKSKVGKVLDLNTAELGSISATHMAPSGALSRINPESKKSIEHYCAQSNVFKATPGGAQVTLLYVQKSHLANSGGPCGMQKIESRSTLDWSHARQTTYLCAISPAQKQNNIHGNIQSF